MYQYSYSELLAPFFEHPERRFHIREYAKLMRIGPMTAKRYLKMLADGGLIVAKPEKIRIKNFQANIENPIFREHKKFYSILKIWNSGLVVYLNDLFLYPPIYVFGSVAKGEDSEGSDLDIFILSDQKATADTLLFEKALKRKVELFVMTTREFAEAKKKNAELVNNILNGVRLSGFLKVFM